MIGAPTGATPGPVRAVPYSYASLYLKHGWAIVRMHYGLVLATSLATAVFYGISYFSPPVVQWVLTGLSIYLGMGQVEIFRRLFNGEAASFRDLFIALLRPDWFKELLPFAVATVIYTIVQSMASEAVGPFVGSFVSLSLMLVWVALTAFSAPLMIYQKRRFADTLTLNFDANTKNVKVLLVFSMMLMGVCLVCSVLLFVPLFLVGVPLTIASAYLCYASIFEGMNIENLVLTPPTAR